MRTDVIANAAHLLRFSRRTILGLSIFLADFCGKLDLLTCLIAGKGHFSCGFDEFFLIVPSNDTAEENTNTIVNKKIEQLNLIKKRPS